MKGWLPPVNPQRCPRDPPILPKLGFILPFGQMRALEADGGALTLAGSRALMGTVTPLKTSQTVAPKPHLSASKPSVRASWRHSGATQGILSVSTGAGGRQGSGIHFLAPLGPSLLHRSALTLQAQHSGADTRVTQLDERQVPISPLTSQEHLPG